MFPLRTDSWKDTKNYRVCVKVYLNLHGSFITLYTQQIGSVKGWGGPYGEAHCLSIPTIVKGGGACWPSRLGTVVLEGWFGAEVGYPTFPRASACNESIKRFAACLSASLSSAVCLLKYTKLSFILKT